MAVTCPSDAECVAVGVEPNVYSPNAYDLVETTDGGATWRLVDQIHDDRAHDLVDPPDCPSEAACYVLIGNTVYATQDRGRTWHDADVESSGHVYARGRISCPAVLTCFWWKASPAATSDVQETTDGAFTWQSHLIQPGVLTGTVSGIACTSPTTCNLLSIGGQLVSHDAATTWQPAKDWPVSSGMRYEGWFTIKRSTHDASALVRPDECLDDYLRPQAAGIGRARGS